jgi:RHS repeat-associated protein
LSGFPWAEAHGYLKLSRCDNLNSIDVEDTYNFENRIVERETSDGRHIEIVYDGDGNRVSKTADGITVYYLVDANNLTGYAQVMEELVTNHVGALVVDRVYTYGLDLISQYKYETAPGAPYWDISYYGYNGHGNVRFLTDSDGNITDTYDYDAFGTLIGQQVLDPSIGLVPVDASNESLVTQNNYLYCGEQFDPDLGLYFLRARYMDTDRGRFWTMDVWEGHLKNPSSLNKYLYANANALSYIDPNGYMSIPHVSAALLISSMLILALTTYLYWPCEVPPKIELVKKTPLYPGLGHMSDLKYNVIVKIKGPKAWFRYGVVLFVKGFIKKNGSYATTKLHGYLQKINFPNYVVDTDEAIGLHPVKPVGLNELELVDNPGIYVKPGNRYEMNLDFLVNVYPKRSMPATPRYSFFKSENDPKPWSSLQYSITKNWP